MAPSQHLRTVEASNVEYKPAVAANGESVYDAPAGTHQVLTAQADTHYTNPQDCGFGYASSIIWTLYERDGDIPDAETLLGHVYDMDVTYKGATYDGWTLMCELAEDFAKRVVRQATWVLQIDGEQVPQYVTEHMTDVCLTFMERQMWLKTLKAMEYEIGAVEAYADAYDASETLVTNDDLHAHDLPGESAGIDAACKVDDEWVTLQVKPAGMPDKGNADVLLTYETAASGKVNIRETDRRED